MGSKSGKKEPAAVIWHWVIREFDKRAARKFSLEHGERISAGGNRHVLAMVQKFPDYGDIAGRMT
jgi:hypothetical protein